MKRTPPWVFVAAVGVQLAALGLCLWAMERNLPAEAEAPAPPPEPEPQPQAQVRDALASPPPAAPDVAFVREPPWTAPWREPEPVFAREPERAPEPEPAARERAPEPEPEAPEVRAEFHRVAGVEVDVEVLLEADAEEPELEPEALAAAPEFVVPPPVEPAPVPRFSEPPAAAAAPRWTPAPPEPEPEPPRRVTIRAVEPPYSSAPRFGPPPERPPEPPPDPDAIPHFITDLADATSQVVGGRVGGRRFAFGFYPDGNIRFVDVDEGRYAGKAESARARMREVDGMRAFTVQIGVGEDRRLQATFTGGLHDAETIALEPLVGWTVA